MPRLIRTLALGTALSGLALAPALAQTAGAADSGTAQALADDNAPRDVDADPGSAPQPEMEAGAGNESQAARCVDMLAGIEGRFNERRDAAQQALTVLAAAAPLVLQMRDGSVVDLRPADVRDAGPTENWFGDPPRRDRVSGGIETLRGLNDAGSEEDCIREARALTLELDQWEGIEPTLVLGDRRAAQQAVEQTESSTVEQLGDERVDAAGDPAVAAPSAEVPAVVEAPATEAPAPAETVTVETTDAAEPPATDEAAPEAAATDDAAAPADGDDVTVETVPLESTEAAETPADAPAADDASTVEATTDAAPSDAAPSDAAVEEAAEEATTTPDAVDTATDDAAAPADTESVTMETTDGAVEVENEDAAVTATADDTGEGDDYGAPAATDQEDVTSEDTVPVETTMETNPDAGEGSADPAPATPLAPEGEGPAGAPEAADEPEAADAGAAAPAALPAPRRMVERPGRIIIQTPDGQEVTPNGEVRFRTVPIE